ncbi:MAG: DUF5655 domain-containing protein [Bdellovibrionota bacterium]
MKKTKFKPKPKSKSKCPPKSEKKVDWIKRLSPKAQERIQREGYHLPNRSEREQVEHLSDDLQDAWGALKAKLLALGEQEMRTSHRSIMFARKTCYAFVRPKKAFIELNFFLPKALDSKILKKVAPVSKTKWVHIVSLTHADQLDWPLTDWLSEAFNYSG